MVQPCNLCLFSVALYRKEAHSLLTFLSVLLKIKIIFSASLRRVNIYLFIHYLSEKPWNNFLYFTLFQGPRSNFEIGGGGEGHQ